MELIWQDHWQTATTALIIISHKFLKFKEEMMAIHELKEAESFLFSSSIVLLMREKPQGWRMPRAWAVHGWVTSRVGSTYTGAITNFWWSSISVRKRILSSWQQFRLWKLKKLNPGNDYSQLPPQCSMTFKIFQINE